jgi:competence protein ComEC
LSSVPDEIERFLASAGFDRAPWLAVAFAGGIAAWFVLDNHLKWLFFMAACAATGLVALAMVRWPYLRQALIAVPLMLLAGCAVIWAKSAIVGQEPVERPVVGRFTAKVLARQEQPAQQRVRLILATREPGTGRAIKVRINVPVEHDRDGLNPGARVNLRARLMPPAPPMLPGGYDFARTAWFDGLAATGTVLGPIAVVEGGRNGGALSAIRASLARHVRERLPDASGGIATALASGDRGGIREADAQAMRDSGLAHLLAISGLHVSAVVGAAYVLAMRCLALWPWLALRVRLPLVAAGIGAVSGIGYTLLTGAQVPTVRSCVGAVLVLAALALGRQALSLRVLAVAAMFVMLLWPESVTGPSFQMSFTAVMVIIALNTAEPVRGFLSPREEGVAARFARYGLALFVTSLLIEIALVPIAFFHFHRSGIYGSAANVIAIPLMTVVTMPAIAIALLLDVIGLGAPAWWLAGKSIDVTLAMAHWVSRQPGAVNLRPAVDLLTMALLVGGGLWLALWQGRVRFWGLLPILAGALSLATLKPPDVLISGDGRHVGITGETQGLLVLREGRSSYARDNLTELSAMDGEVTGFESWPGARCSQDFCALDLKRDARTWRLLVSRSTYRVPERELAAACDRADIVIADRWLPRSCQPHALRADRSTLSHSGGLAIWLDTMRIESVAEGQGEHGWWRERGRRNGRAVRKSTDAQTESVGRRGVAMQANTGAEAPDLAQ